MINKDTILSVYTDKQTLLEYLTKIETALDKAVLTSSQLVYEGGNNYHFKFVFEDGSSIETPSITLVQPISKVDFLANGNSVHFVFTLMDGETITTQTINLLKPVTAAAVRDGILYLTLSDGTEVSAGSITASFGATTFNGDVLVEGNAILGGNAEVDGNLQVNGVMKQNSWEYDKDLSSLFPAQSGVTIEYAHARESNGKLSIVVYVQTDSSVSLYSKTVLAEIPEHIYNQLYPSVGAMLDIKNYSTIPTFESTSGSLGSKVTGSYFLRIYKAGTNKISLDIHLEGAPAVNYVAINRFEFNFILS